LILTSCTSSYDDPTTTDQDSVLVRKYTYGRNDQTITTNLIYNGNKVVSTNSTGGISEKFTYTGNLITKIEQFFYDDLEQSNTYVYNSDQKLETFISLIPTMGNGKKVTFVYNSDGTTSYSKFTGNLTSQATLEETGKIFYTNGEIIQIESIAGTTTTIQNFTYDEKNNPFKNCMGFSAISFPAISFSDFQVDGKSRNVLTYSSSSSFNNFGATYTYTYNDSNFPITVLIQTDNFSVGVNEFFYE
jgi:hypothetical protein